MSYKHLNLNDIDDKAPSYGVDSLDRESLSEAVSCDVTAGPEAGRSFVHLPGRHDVGRSTGATVHLDDVTVSDHQLAIIVYDDLVTGNVVVHAFYVKYLLPIWFDVQSIDHKPGTGPAKRWQYAPAAS